MAVLAKLNGMVVRVNGDDYTPPHFHVVSPDVNCIIRIGGLGVHRGALPAKATKIILSWAEENRDALWNTLNPDKPY